MRNNFFLTKHVNPFLKLGFAILTVNLLDWIGLCLSLRFGLDFHFIYYYVTYCCNILFPYSPLASCLGEDKGCNTMWLLKCHFLFITELARSERQFLSISFKIITNFFHLPMLNLGFTSFWIKQTKTTTTTKFSQQMHSLKSFSSPYTFFFIVSHITMFITHLFSTKKLYICIKLQNLTFKLYLWNYDSCYLFPLPTLFAMKHFLTDNEINFRSWII